MAFVKIPTVKDSDDQYESLHSSQEGNDFVICKSPDKLKRLLSSLEKGKQTHYVSDGDWSMHDIIVELLKQYRPAELYLSTYAIREFAIRQLIMAMERKDLISVNMLLDYRAKTRTPEVFQLASMNMSKIFLTSIHAKVTVLRCAHGNITIVGSANWTQNPRIECGVISLDDSVAQYHINWMQKIMSNAELFS